MPLLPFSHQKPPTTNNNNGGCSRIPKKYPGAGGSFARERRLTIDLGLAMFSSSPASTANLGPSRSQTPTTTATSTSNPLHNPQMNGSFTLTLPRDRPSPSPKCFGKSTHMLKEDYERERLRWEKKLEEAEQKLNEAAIHNSELFQLKAELNRKIIDFEKSQRPLIEQNRRLNDRIKASNEETRKLEEKLAHVLDELLSLKDAYERVQKENTALREQRAFPEKLEELNRYRSQVLEMSKCITALRQSAAEKDRRQDLLILKLKRMRNRTIGQESDRQSCTAGSEGSVEDSGSLGLDTITEDLDEEMELGAATLGLISDGRVPHSGDFVLMRQQLDVANEMIAESQREMDRIRTESAHRVAEEMSRIRAELDTARKRERLAEQQLANAQTQNELLEFQLVELTTTMRQQQQKADKMCTTDMTIPVDTDQQKEGEESFEDEPRKRHTMSMEQINATKEDMRRVVASSMLLREERLSIRHGLEAIECLRNQIGFLETELNMAHCEMGRLQREGENRERDWLKQREEAQNERQQKKRELKAELEQLRKERREQESVFARQVEELSAALNNKMHAISDLTDRKAQLGAELDICRCKLAAAQSENALAKEQMAQCLREKEKTERELVRLKAQLEEVGARLSRETEERGSRERDMEAAMAKLKTDQTKDRTELDRLRTYNRELEAQFNAQMEMLGALKRKLLTMKDASRDGTPSATVRSIPGPPTPDWLSGARSCGSTEDEQYHSEGSDESLATNGAKGRNGNDNKNSNDSSRRK